MDQKSDKAILALRQARHRVSRKFHHDVTKIVQYYQKLQQNYADRLISPTSKASHSTV